MVACSLETLGAFAFRVDGRTVTTPATQKARALLVYLVMHQNVEIARERLLDLFWPDSEPGRARDSLRTALYSIRRTLRDAGVNADPLLVANKSTVRWAAATEFDVTRLIALAESGDNDAPAKALGLYRGDFLEGDYDEWTVAQRELVASTYEGLLSKALASAKDPQVARRLIDRNPYEEEAYATLVDAELAAGRQVAAGKLIAQYRAALEEMSAKPTAEFERRYETVMRVQAPVAAAPRLPFVGRETELARIAAALEDRTAGRRAVVVVHGEPGIGKSALLQVAADHAMSAGMGVFLVRAVSDDPRPFGIWGPLYESLVGGNFADFARSAPEAQNAVVHTVIRSLPSPTVLFVDDAQYLRGESLDLFSNLARRLSASPHLLVVGSRPEGLRTLSSILGPLGTLDLELPALSGIELDGALDISGFRSRSELLDMLMRRTGGHPLYVNSLLETLANDGAFRRVGGTWELARAISADIALPASLGRSIETRLRSRGACAAEVACMLALDADASTDDLTALVGHSGNVLDALDDLLALGVLFEPSSGPQFAFSHDLVREVASRLLGAAHRQRIHRQLADRLAGVPVPDGAIRRARHLEAARDVQAAAEAYEAAALAAMELNASREAATRFERALDMLRGLERVPAIKEKTFELMMLRARSLHRCADLSATMVAADEMVRTVRSGTDRAMLAESLAFRAYAGIAAKRYDDVLRDAAEVAKLGEELGSPGLRARSLARIVGVHTMLCNEAPALEAARSALAAALETDDPRIIGLATDAAAPAQIGWWQFEQARQTIQIAKAAAEKFGWIAECRATITCAVLWYHAKLWEKASAELDSAETLLGQQYRTGKRDFDIPPSELRFAIDYHRALIDSASGSWASTIPFCHDPERELLTDGSAAEDRYYVRAMFIDAVLEGKEPDGLPHAAELIQLLAESDTFPPGCYNGSFLLPYVLQARLAARLRLPEARGLLDVAMDRAAVDAARAPSDCERALERLARSAAEIGYAEAAARALELRDSYATRHAAAVKDLSITT